MKNIQLDVNLKEKIRLLVILSIVACTIMAFIEVVISPMYFYKSVSKIVLFLVIPSYYLMKYKDASFKDIFIPTKKGLLLALALGLGVYLIIVVGYFVIHNFFDFSSVTTSLQSDIGVNKDNFLFVSLYISFINSFLEEFFFRGFIFLGLLKLSSRQFSYVFSAALFALYHIAMMINWFDPILLVLLILGLFIAGVFFNFLNEKNKNIYTSWLVHMFANFGINTVGFILFAMA